MVSRTPNVPRRIEARNALLKNIDNGKWPAGERLPPEPELAVALGVSRATLREAMRSLTEDGYIERKPGAGTRVVYRSVLPTSLDNNVGVADIIRSMGMIPGTSSLEFHMADAPDDVAHDLSLGDRRRVAVIERVRTANGNPVVFSTHYFPPQAGWDEGAMLAGFDAESLYTLLETRAGIKIQYATATIEPARADSVLAKRLAISEEALLMHFRQVDYVTNGRPVIFSSEYYRSEAFEFRIYRRGPRPVSGLRPGPLLFDLVNSQDAAAVPPDSDRRSGDRQP
jgi:GntR family transcriptional regulator